MVCHRFQLHFCSVTMVKEISQNNLSNLRNELTVGSILVMTSCNIWMSLSSKHFCISCNSKQLYKYFLWQADNKHGLGWTFLWTYRWQGLINFNRIEPPRAQTLLTLFFLILLHGLFDADLCPAPNSLLKRLQLIIKRILVLLICCLLNITSFVSYSFNI